MTIVYCAQDKRKLVHAQLDLEPPYLFASPTDQAVDHSATRVIIVGNHQSIEDRYKGLAKIEYFEPEPSGEDGEENEPESEPDSED